MFNATEQAVSIIIPIYNEKDNIKALHQEIITALSFCKNDYEIIFVDDGSTDGSRQEIKRLMQSFEQTRLIAHAKNSGQSTALVSGAYAARYPLLITLDGDGQNDPKDIPNLLAACVDARTVILGIRVRRKDSSLRMFSSWVGNRIRGFILKDDCPDTGCSLKLFPRQAFLELPHFNHLHRYLPALFKRAGFKLVNLPVNHRPRLHGHSKYGVWNRLFVGIYDLIGVRWLLNRPCMTEYLSDES